MNPPWRFTPGPRPPWFLCFLATPTPSRGVPSPVFPHLPFGPCAFCNEMEEESHALDASPFRRNSLPGPWSPCYLVDGVSWHQRALALT